MSFNCDKCGTDVPAANDAVYFDLILTGDPLLVLAISRHLLPVVVGGEVICAGSPSRAQYIEGQPRDERSDHSYIPGQEVKIRAAYAKMLENVRIS